MSKDSIQSLVIELQYLENAAQVLQQRINLVDAAITEIQIANSTIEGLKKESVGSEILVPIGGGSYIRAKIGDSEKLIVGIGANVAIEKSLSEAAESYKARINDLQKTRAAMEKQIDQILVEIERRRQELQKLVKEAEGKGDV
ncbi:MAG: prefoldin subunit alpha [Candidatus Bathyarchaeia archaeon]